MLKRILPVLLLLGCLQNAFASVSLIVADIKASSNSADVTSNSLNTSGADFCWVSWSTVVGTLGTLTDSKMNTPTGTHSSGTSYDVETAYYVSPTVGSGHTFIVTGAVAPTITVICLSGMANSMPFDVGSGTGFTTTDHVAPGSISPSATTNVIFYTVADPNAATAGDVSSDDMAVTKLYAGDGIVSIITASFYKLSTGATENPTVTWLSGNSNGYARMESYISVSGGGATRRRVGSSDN